MYASVDDAAARVLFIRLSCWCLLVFQLLEADAVQADVLPANTARERQEEVCGAAIECEPIHLELVLNFWQRRGQSFYMTSCECSRGDGKPKAADRQNDVEKCFVRVRSMHHKLFQCCI